MLFEVIEPKDFMLNGKNAFPEVTYENFLIDVINCSHFFSEKRPIMEYYKLVEEQSMGRMMFIHQRINLILSYWLIRM